jgi:hypothetical protein
MRSVAVRPRCSDSTPLRSAAWTARAVPADPARAAAAPLPAPVVARPAGPPVPRTLEDPDDDSAARSSRSAPAEARDEPALPDETVADATAPPAPSTPALALPGGPAPAPPDGPLTIVEPMIASLPSPGPPYPLSSELASAGGGEPARANTTPAARTAILPIASPRSRHPNRRRARPSPRSRHPNRRRASPSPRSRYPNRRRASPNRPSRHARLRAACPDLPPTCRGARRSRLFDQPLSRRPLSSRCRIEHPCIFVSNVRESKFGSFGSIARRNVGICCPCHGAPANRIPLSQASCPAVRRPLWRLDHVSIR